VFTGDSVTIGFWLASVSKSATEGANHPGDKDINLRIKADALGLLAEDYENDRVFIKDLIPDD